MFYGCSRTPNVVIAANCLPHAHAEAASRLMHQQLERCPCNWKWRGLIACSQEPHLEVVAAGLCAANAVSAVAVVHVYINLYIEFGCFGRFGCFSCFRVWRFNTCVRACVREFTRACIGA